MKPFAASDRARRSKVAEIRRYFEKLIEPMRETARAHGYALAVHGSGQRDIDVLAAPWTDGASHPADLLVALLETIHKHNGGAGFIEMGESVRSIGGEKKPHGRRAWSIHLADRGGVYIDLSVMPRKP